jgi:hypothetical protein
MCIRCRFMCMYGRHNGTAVPSVSMIVCIHVSTRIHNGIAARLNIIMCIHGKIILYGCAFCEHDCVYACEYDSVYTRYDALHTMQIYVYVWKA